MSTVTPKLNLVKPATIEQYSLATYNNNLDKLDASAVVDANMSEGLKAITKVVANSGSVTALTVIQNIASFTFKGGRKYHLVWSFQYQGSVAGNYCNASINSAPTADPAAQISGMTAMGNKQWKIHDAAVTHTGFSEAWYEPVSDITLQIKFCLQVTTGAGTSLIVSSASSPSWLTIDDRGDQI